MKRPVIYLSSFVLLPAIMIGAAGSPGSRKRAVAPGDDEFGRLVAPFTTRYCTGCHSGPNAPKGVSLAGVRSVSAMLKARDVWDRAARALADHAMPPANSPPPPAAERNKVAAWIESTLSKADCEIKNPGRVTLRRLNREEYNNTVRDLIGLDLRPADAFPSDDVGYGFDNIGDVLSISPLLMEKYIQAAEKVATAAIVVPGGKPQVNRTRYSADQIAKISGMSQASTESRLLLSNGELGVDHAFPKDGEYMIRVRGYGMRVGPDLPKFTLRIDGADLLSAEMQAGEFRGEGPVKAREYEAKAQVKSGRRRITVAFTNEFYQPRPNGEPGRRRGIAVQTIEVDGPLGDSQSLPASHRRILFCSPADSSPAAQRECARKILARFTRRAFRRPVAKTEIDRLLRYVDATVEQKEPFERGIQLAVEAVLVSPSFLFRAECDPPNAKGERPLNSYELATRLSYFLWSTMPDEELSALADSGRLVQPQTLAAQVRRMMKDPKSRALTDNFAAQWLMLRNLNNVSPDTERFPAWTAALRQAMRTESELFFNSIVNEDRSVLDFLDSKFTFLNETLAKHYGIPGIAGDQFRQVKLTGDQRGGLLGQASILTVTSNPTRTSPVKRGKWVLENLFNTPPPPPLPDIPQLEQQGELKGTLRQRMEQHRKDPKCAVCHAQLDPLGFGLENYDAIGAWRTKDGDASIDSSGVLPGGRSFRGPAELKKILLGKKVQFVRCLTEKLMTYALGRGLEPRDKCYVEEVVRSVANSNYRFSALVTGIVQSDPFRKRRVDRQIASATGRLPARDS